MTTNLRAIAKLGAAASVSVAGLCEGCIRHAERGDVDATLEKVQRLVRQGHFELEPLQQALRYALPQMD